LNTNINDFHIFHKTYNFPRFGQQSVITNNKIIHTSTSLTGLLGLPINNCVAINLSNEKWTEKNWLYVKVIII